MSTKVLTNKVGQRKEEAVGQIKASVAAIFNQVDKMFDIAEIILESNSKEIALDLIDEDKYVDQLQKDLIVEVSNFIIKEQPMANDLRVALGSHTLSYDLERIGDYLKNFARTMIKTDGDCKGFEEEIKLMINLLQERLEETLEAFMNSDHKAAKSIAHRDKEIDELSTQLFEKINTAITQEIGKSDAKKYTRIFLLAKLFERTGDHLVNICEQISYIERGQLYYYS
ncbi:MAG: phosphate signaling complex protein PhoU [Mycoplasmatales bacterium]